MEALTPNVTNKEIEVSSLYPTRTISIKTVVVLFCCWRRSGAASFASPVSLLSAVQESWQFSVFASSLTHQSLCLQQSFCTPINIENRFVRLCCCKHVHNSDQSTASLTGAKLLSLAAGKIAALASENINFHVFHIEPNGPDVGNRWQQCYCAVNIAQKFSAAGRRFIKERWCVFEWTAGASHERIINHTKSGTMSFGFVTDIPVHPQLIKQSADPHSSTLYRGLPNDQCDETSTHLFSTTKSQSAWRYLLKDEVVYSAPCSLTGIYQLVVRQK